MFPVWRKSNRTNWRDVSADAGCETAAADIPQSDRFVVT